MLFLFLSQLPMNIMQHFLKISERYISIFETYNEVNKNLMHLLKTRNSFQDSEYSACKINPPLKF